MAGEQRAILAITMGDATGIGPEIAVRALAQAEIYELCCPLILGDAKVIRATVDGMGLDVNVHAVEAVEQAQFDHGTVDVLDFKNIE